MKRNNGFRYYIEKINFFNDDEVNEIKSNIFGNSHPTKNTNGKRAELVGLTGSEVRDYRRANQFEFNNDEIIQKIINVTRTANQLHFNYDINWDSYESFKLLKYEKGDGYGWHPDFGQGKESTRKLSIIVQLSDSDDYDGGDLEFAITTKDDDDFVKATRKKGSIIIFNPLIVHRITPIISGTRYSMVGWIHGDTFR